MSRAEGLTVREAGEADIPEILDLMRLSLGETDVLQRTSDLFRWKHLDNPFGRSILLVGEIGGSIAGFRAFMRWGLTDQSGASYSCLRPVDTATHPDHRRKGIFRTLTLEAVERARSEGVHLIFNTPNRDSGAGYLTMGWSMVGGIGVMATPTGRMLTRSGPFAQAPPPVTGLASDRLPLGLRTVRSSEYRQWRFASHPTASYVMLEDNDGTVIARRNIRNSRREVVMSEIIGDPRPATIRALLSRHRAHYGVGWFGKRSPERRILHSAGFLPVPGVDALTLAALPLRPGTDAALSLDGWDIGLGDLELL